MYASTKTGPETANKSKTVIEPNPEPPDDLNQFQNLKLGPQTL